MSYYVIIKFVCIIILQIFETEDNHHLFLFFTKKQFWRPLLINVCLISIQQLCGYFSLTYKLQYLYGILSMSEIIPTVTEMLLLQVFSYFYRVFVYLVGIFE